MAPLRDTRRERFCQLLVEGQSATAAYASAGYNPSGPNAGRLRNKPEVAARIAELQAESAQSHAITVESICQELDTAIELAKNRGMPNAMINAAALRAKLAGLGSERQIVEINDGRGSFDTCENAEQVAQQWADSALDGVTNARWRLITEEDRNYLASLFLEFTNRSREFLRSIEARPPHTEQNPIISIAKARNGSSPVSNGK